MKTFHEQRPLYEAFTICTDHIITELLKIAKIEVASQERRTKEIDSFEEKAVRSGKEYLDPLNEITDICGIRLIAYQSSDVSKICQIIEDSFEVDEYNSVDKNESIDPDRFGYLSVHYVVRLRPDRINLPEYKRFENLKAEIQVRTVLQHAWAAIDHKLR